MSSPIDEQRFPIPDGKYISHSSHDYKELVIQYKEKKKVALLFISINPRYWPYLLQVIEDSKKNFLPHHQVDFFVWSDIDSKNDEAFKSLVELDLGLLYNKQGRVPTAQQVGEIEKKVAGYREAATLLEKDPRVTIIPTEPIEWPHPTLMRYHLFLQKEEKLKEYDYLFYLDADMRVVDFVGDEIMGEGLTVAEHPMYALRKEYIPPYEPNKDSTAYIPRVGIIVNENGKPRLKPIYAAGGLQGGISKDFIEAMHSMKKNIDKDFLNNYTAIWNDESHWNRHLLDYQGHMVVLPPAYVYPDSIQKQYYEPIWGRSYQPKIVTLTKPFTLTKEGGEHLKQLFGGTPQDPTQFSCPQCGDILSIPGHRIIELNKCNGAGKGHDVKMLKL